ncbi:hypothetical protein B0T40_09725 [Chromobacterium haemolyticum]|uniref:hypothetical protein n=1 Tax=Chromobacterium haemolyticum TaxID=394935 RepID=UPI0009D9DD5E|nr:hypothetical protein [Chromobacterium haemolyticum]OQS36664.1 hypothetical protein B0T40_09725 [Chromobacterium haemolyticum]
MGADSGLVEWVLESGDPDKDAAYLDSLRGSHGGAALRLREMKRLKLVYGDGYKMNVERALSGDVPQLAAEMKNGGRNEALAMLNK